MSWLNDKKVLVTGGAGFLGQHVVKKLRDEGCKDIFIPRSRDYDLIFREDALRMFQEFEADIVIHLAATVGGIGANKENPGKFLYENLMMGMNVIDASKEFKVEKFVLIGTICSYPKFTPVPFKEESLWDGYPEETNAPYGIAKRALVEMVDAYHKQYDFPGICLLPVNLYGPGDNFDPDTSHVIPALIKKCMDAVENKVNWIEIWGTGNATREFLYVEDAAEGIVKAIPHSDPSPINLGIGKEISIKELVYLICELTSFSGKVIWDTTKPDGQPRRCLDVYRARRAFGFNARTTLEEGLEKTVKWYKQQRGLE